MSHILTNGLVETTLPFHRHISSAPFSTSTLNATGETLQFVGDVFLENPTVGAKTISAAGGGSIIWRSGTTTFADGASVFNVGLQDVSTTSSPSQGGGTFDVKATFTGSGITTAAVNASVMTSGTKTIAHGDSVAISLEFTTRAGADSVVVTYMGLGTKAVQANMGGVCVDNTSGSFAVLAGYPMAIIKFDDGTIGYIVNTNFYSANSTTAINSTTATADEYGTLINVPFTFGAAGIQATITFAGNASDCELILYSDPFGTPVAERTITVDATQIGATAAGRPVSRLFPADFIIKANTDYVVSVRPTTANNITLAYEDGIADSIKLNAPNNYAYAVRRLDNAGAFSDTNGGTAKTRLYRICLFGYKIGQGVNFANSQIGI